uniref:(northern house mosquito) hypothetical protein n=1 Tax=Culex pipiens TaxID=7175 RepID=A0A8D8D7I0_CULPI
MTAREELEDAADRVPGCRSMLGSRDRLCDFVRAVVRVGFFWRWASLEADEEIPLPVVGRTFWAVGVCWEALADDGNRWEARGVVEAFDGSRDGWEGVVCLPPVTVPVRVCMGEATAAFSNASMRDLIGLCILNSSLFFLAFDWVAVCGFLATAGFLAGTGTGAFSGLFSTRELSSVMMLALTSGVPFLLSITKVLLAGGRTSNVALPAVSGDCTTNVPLAAAVKVPFLSIAKVRFFSASTSGILPMDTTSGFMTASPPSSASS